MAEYIEREALKAEFMKHYACEYPAALVMAIIDNVSTADVAEVRHGKRLDNEVIKMKVDTSIEPSHVKAVDFETKEVHTFACYPCPNCGKWIHANTNQRYCEWCGVKLDWLIDKQRKEDEGK